MGQKVNPVGMRLVLNKDWKSTWYARENDKYASFVAQDNLIREYIKKQLDKSVSSINQILIERFADRLKVTIDTARSAVIIGDQGKNVKNLKEGLAKVVKNAYISVDVKEVNKPELSALLVANNVAKQLERRVMFRRAMKRAIQTVLRAGAKGVKIAVSGRLGGAEIARTEWYREGRVPLHTFRADIDYASVEALTTYGIIGVKVWIYKGEIFKEKRTLAS